MIKGGRGSSYNIKKIMELYDFGMKSADIASIIKIQSIQSLRHAIERQNILRQRLDELTAKIRRKKEAGERAMWKKLEAEQRRKENLKRIELKKLISSSDAGLFQHTIGRSTYMALRYVIEQYREIISFFTKRIWKFIFLRVWTF